MSMREPTYMEADQAALGQTNDSQESTAKRRDLRPLRQLIPYLLPYKKQMLWAFAALFLAAVSVLTIGSGLKSVVDSGFATGNPDKLNQTLILLFLVIAVMAGATYGRFYLVSWIGERVVADMRRALFQHLLALSPSFFESARSGDLVSRMNADTGMLQVVIGSSISIALRNLLLLIGGTIMMLITSAKLTGLVFLVVPLVIVPIIFFGRRVKTLSKTSQEKLSDVGAGLEETIYGIRTLQAFGREAHEEARFAAKVEEAFGTSLQRIAARALMIVIVITLVFGAIALILWLGGHDVLAGRMSAGQLSAFIFYAILVAGAVGAVSEVMGDLQRAAGATERIFELLTLEPEIKAPATPRTLPVPPRGEITFDNVSFFYPSRPQAPALDHFELRIRAGEKVALVGPSGAGKSTLFQLLLRFYDPQMGRVLVDGYDIREVDPKSLRQRISFVPQDNVIFSTDALTNIRLGRSDASDGEAANAAAAANADEFIRALPEGYFTFLGEKGVRISGGQRQRIGLARAILRNAPILLLDEATSALDSQNEKAVQEALAHLMQGRTTLIIAHRLSTIRHCDRIIVMDKGQIVETGTHDQLLAKGGLYAQLSKLQFRG